MMWQEVLGTEFESILFKIMVTKYIAEQAAENSKKMHCLQNMEITETGI
jgi:hypothetical protein